MSGGSSITKAVLDNRDKHFSCRWPQCAELAKEADRVGLEILIADGVQRGFGGEIAFRDEYLDALTSIAALSQVTSNILLISSVDTRSHLHPLHVARFGGNFDHMSGGRWALLLTTQPDPEGEEPLGLKLQKERKIVGLYETVDEFVTLMKHWWSMPTAFEFQGTHFQSRHVHMVGPKPTRKPRPFLITTAQDQAGIDFAAKHCDWLLCRNPSGDLDELNAQIRQAKVQSITPSAEI